MDSVLKANKVFYKDNVGWVKLKRIKEPVSNRILLTENIYPVYSKNIEGKITVNLRVSEAGDVISASIGSPTNISDAETKMNAIEAAKKLKFSRSNVLSSGSITYYFKLE